jgi:acetoin:2,6-dichlorophenolindophenol oxidoreductase subunit alpha
MAAIYKLPVVYICENNLYAVSTNVKKSTSCENISDRSISYNIPGYQINGNDPMEVYLTVKKAVKFARDGNGPSLIEAKTLRYTGHHLNDAEDYRDKEEVRLFRKTKDPLSNFIDKLLEKQIITDMELKKIEDEIAKEIEEAVAYAENSPEPSLEEFLKEIN